MVIKKKDDGRRKVLLVDDHPIMRKGLTELIGRESDLAVCGEAEDVHDALKAVESLAPDIVVVDLTLKNSNGIDLIKDIRIRWPKLPVLVLSMHENAVYAEHALRAGAQGYLTKQQAPGKVVEGLRKILDGDIYISERMAAKMLSGFVSGKASAKGFTVDRLSEREFEIFQMIAKGLQTREIAERLHISIKTVEAHREHIKAKLNLDTAAELLKYAIHWTQLESQG